MIDVKTAFEISVDYLKKFFPDISRIQIEEIVKASPKNVAIKSRD